MSFFGSGFDPRAEVIGLIDLVEIDAPSGVARFMLGRDGRFTDSLGRDWWGSQLISGSALDFARGAVAPAGELVLSYFQDPAAGDLITQLRESGDAVLNGRRITFWRQPIASVVDFYAPRVPPRLLTTRTAAGLSFVFEGDVVRRIVLRFEGPMEARRAVRARFYTVPDHNALVGSTGNPSLALMPDGTRPIEEKLFG